VGSTPVCYSWNPEVIPDPDTGYPDRDIPPFFLVLQRKYHKSALN